MMKYICLLLTFCLALPQPALAENLITPKEHQRGVEQTYLTFPEWFLVFSPAEYAAYVKDKDPSGFPFLRHVGQFWGSYGAVYKATKEKYPMNWGYHIMIMVIGTSTTLEYGLKSAYENTIGRVSGLTRTHGMTEEDVLAANVAQDYVDFINVTPWYEYNFSGKLKEVWTKTHFRGNDAIRKWERKYALTTEYGIKAGYGWIIKKLTKMSYETPSLVTAVVVDTLPQDTQTLPELKILKTLPNGGALVTVPRYAAFTHYASELAKQGIHFREIAGNTVDKPILVSIIVPSDWQATSEKSPLLFEQQIITQTNKKRIVLEATVGTLHEVLLHFSEAPFHVEHVFDY